MLKWLHHLLNPHCEHCIAEKICKSCEVLNYELARERDEKKELLNRVLDMTAPKPVLVTSVSNPSPIAMSSKESWNAVRQRLEARDKEIAEAKKHEAQTRRQFDKETEELEQTLLGNE